MGLFANPQNLTERLFYKPTGQVFVSALFGVALALLFEKICKDRKCILITAPSVSEMSSKVYQFEGECYKYKPYGTKCPENDSEVVKSV